MPSYVPVRRPNALVVLLVAVIALLGSGLVAGRASAALPPCLKCDWPPEVGPPLPEPETQIITAPPALTADPQPYFSFSVAGAPGMIQFFTCSWVPDTVSLWEPSTQFDCPSEKSTVGTNVPFPYGGDYPDRQYRLRVMGCQMTFISVANCDRTPALVTFRVDRTGPTLAFDAGTAAEGAHLPAAKQTVAWHALENGITDYTCVLDARATFSNCGTASLFTWTGDGQHTVSITAKDALGNVGPALTRSWVVDTKAPVTTWTTTPPALGKERRPAVAYKGTDADLTLTASCTLEGPLGTTTPSCTATGWTPTADLADGSYTFSVRHTDRAGHASVAVRTTFAIDATPPELGAVSWDERTGRFTFSAGPGGTVTCSLDGGPFAPCASPFDGSALAPGSHELLVRSVDALGNRSERRLTIVVPEPPKPDPTPAPSPSPKPVPSPSPTPVAGPSLGPTPAAQTPGTSPAPIPAPPPGASVAPGSVVPGGAPSPGSPAATPGAGSGSVPFAADAGLTERSSPEAVAQAFGLPSAKACLSKRAFPIRLKVPPGVAVKSASIAVNGKTSKARPAKGRWQATVDLRGLRKGRVTVRIKVTTTAGKTLTGTRSYGVCGAKRGA